MEKVYGTLVLMVGAAIMIAARRFNSDYEPNAGIGIAGWTMVILLAIWL